MSELTLSLKNKKNHAGIAAQGGGRNNDSNGGSYKNLIKPLISGRTPQTTKNTPAQMDNFSARSYTQRVGAANASSNGVGSNFTGSGNLRSHQMATKNQVVKQGRVQA